jgi:hypothetical protein
MPRPREPKHGHVRPLGARLAPHLDILVEGGEDGGVGVQMQMEQPCQSLADLVARCRPPQLQHDACRHRLIA